MAGGRKNRKKSPIRTRLTHSTTLIHLFRVSALPHTANTSILILGILNLLSGGKCIACCLNKTLPPIYHLRLRQRDVRLLILFRRFLAHAHVVSAAAGVKELAFHQSTTQRLQKVEECSTRGVLSPNFYMPSKAFRMGFPRHSHTPPQRRGRSRLTL